MDFTKNSVAGSTVTLSHPAALTLIETHRVLSVVEKGMERLRLLTLLDEQGSDAQAAAQSMPGNETRTAAAEAAAGDDAQRGVGHLLEDHKRLESRYEELITATQKVKHNPNDPLLDPTCFSHVRNDGEERQLNELRDVSRRLKDQSRALCRQLRDNPNDSDNWKKITAERGELMTIMDKWSKELASSCATTEVRDAAHGGRPTGSYAMFALQVLEEEAASKWAEDLVRKEKETNQNVKQLQNDVRSIRQLKEEELEKRHRSIAELKTELRLVKQTVKEQSEKLKAGTEAASEAQQRQAFDQQRKLNDRIAHIRRRLEDEREVSDHLKAHIDERVAEIEKTNDQWTAKAQDEQRRMGNEKSQKDTERSELAERLRERLESTDVAQVAKQAREEEMKRKTQDKELHENLNNARYAAATKLQASIKAFFTRSTLVVLKKKAAKGRKKKA